MNQRVVLVLKGGKALGGVKANIYKNGNIIYEAFNHGKVLIASYSYNSIRPRSLGIKFTVLVTKWGLTQMTLYSPASPSIRYHRASASFKLVPAKLSKPN
jgi:hypothetical protein